MRRTLLTLIVLTSIMCRSATGQESPNASWNNLTAEDYITYYQVAAMQGSENLFGTIHQKLTNDIHLHMDQNSQAYKNLKKLDGHYTNYFKFKELLLKHLNGYRSKQDLDTRILSTIRFGEKFNPETASDFEQQQYKEQYTQSYMEGFFTSSDHINRLPVWTKFMYESYGQALENAIISYVKILSFEKELLEANKQVKSSVVNEIWQQFDKFLPVQNPEANSTDKKTNNNNSNNKLNYSSNDVASFNTLQDPKKVFWNKKIVGAILKVASNTQTHTGSVLAETTKKIQKKAMDINHALYNVNESIRTHPDVYEQSNSVLTLFKITQNSIAGMTEYQKYVKEYLAAVAEGPGMLLVTNIMSSEDSDKNPYSKAAIGGLRTAKDLKRMEIELPSHNTNTNLIDNNFVEAAIVEAEGNIIATMTEFKQTLVSANTGEKQLDQEVLTELVNFFPEAVALTVNKHPEYNTDEISSKIAASIISVDTNSSTKESHRKIWMWAGIGVGVVCLATGILSWAGTGLISASVATSIAIAATAFGLVDTGYQNLQMNEHESNYQLFHDSYLSGNIDTQGIKDAKTELDAFEDARLAYYISAGVSILNVSVFLVDLRYLAFAKSGIAAEAGEPKLLVNIAQNLDKGKLRSAGLLLTNKKLTSKLLSMVKLEDSEKFIFKLANEIADPKILEKIDKETLKAINKMLSLDCKELGKIVTNALAADDVKILTLLRTGKEIKIATEIEKGMDLIKAQLNNQKAFDNFMKYFNELVKGKKANALLRIQNIETNFIKKEIGTLDFLYQDYSPEHLDDFAKFITKWKKLSYVPIEPELYNEANSGTVRLIKIYQQGDDITGDFNLFMAQPENQEIILKLLEVMNPMSLNDGWAFLSTLDQAGPFLDKFRILKNEPQAAHEILGKIRDLLINNPESLFIENGTLDIDRLCKMVDIKVDLMGGSKALTQDLFQVIGTEDDKIASILWYPKFMDGAAASHTKLNLNGIAYSSIDNKFSIFNYTNLQRAAYLNSSGKFGFYKIDIRITAQEARNIEKIVQELAGAPNYSLNCVRTSSHIINKATSMKIPFPFSNVPTLNAAYLKAAKMLGYNRISSIEFVGHNELNTLFSPGMLSELGIATFLSASAGLGTYTAYKVIVWAVDSNDNEVPLVIEHKVDGVKDNSKDNNRPLDNK